MSFLLLTAAIVFSSGPVFSQTLLSETRHKIQVSDPALAKQIESSGGKLIADYGSYKLYESDALTSSLTNSPQSELRDEYNFVQLNAGHLDTRKAAVKALRKSRASFSGKRMHLVHFVGPVQPGWRDELMAAGVQIVSYIPQNAYLVYGDAASLARVQALTASAPHVQWEGEYLDDYKIHPAARTTDDQGNPRKIGTDQFAVQLIADTNANSNTLQLLEQLKLEPIHRREAVLHYVNVIVRLSPDNLKTLAAQPDVVSIQPYFPRKKFGEHQDQIIAGNLSGGIPTGPGYLAWLASKGFTQAQFNNSGFTVDVSDSGIDNGTTVPNHFGLFTNATMASGSRVIYNRLVGTPNTNSTLQGCDGHGNLNSHIIGGYDNFSGFPFADSSGYHYGLGVCPFVKLGSSVVFDPDNFTSPNYANLQSQAYNNGARVSNNSWGGGSSGAYDIDAQSFDALVRDAQPTGATFAIAGNQEMVIVFAAGNNGPGASTVGTPGTAKNVISVGAAENVQAIGGTDDSGVSDLQADNANDIISFSSRGPCTDGRHKPEIVAPGTHVSGGAPQAANPGPTGTVNSCFSGDGVSGGPDGSLFFPLNQQFYTASSGTSHSTPCVSGACALLRQYFLNNFTNAPSPAMTKAYLMNSARYLTGAAANDTLWSDTQGMGELNLGTAFDGTPRLLRDELAADMFTASGQTRTFTGVIGDTNKPFLVTVSWTDAPGSTTGNAFNNNLDLTVTAGGNTYKGNVFSGAYSTTGGTADLKNNAESVFLPAGVSGSFTVTVAGTSINSDGVPNTGTATDQDFALVVYNVSPTTPYLVPRSSALTAEGCAPSNGVIDSGETVTVSFALQNIGTVNTTNLVATLLTNSGFTASSGPQTYGALTAGGAVVTKSFSFTATASCGSNISAVLQLQDGAANRGTVTFNLPVGSFVTNSPFSQNFDSLVAPALPSGWITGFSGAELAWVSSTTKADTLPNAMFANDAAGIGLSELISPTIAINSANAQLTFRNNYNLEASSTNSTVGYDGSVLEIQIGTNGFNDILVAGGNFVTGGYNRIISSLYSNPLSGRSAWSGNSTNFITTKVNLPATAAGQNIVLKWRCGSDNSNGGTGWFIDSVAVTDGAYTCCSGSIAPVIVSGPTNLTVAVGSNATFQTIASGTAPLLFQWRFNTTNISTATTSALTLTNVQPSQAGTYSVVVTNAAGSTNASAQLRVLVSPVVTSINASGINVSIAVNSVSGLNYSLEYKNSLTNATWTIITPSVSGTGGPITLHDTNANQSKRFYRVLVQ